jgi:Calx-beta domain-containing protein
VRPRTALVAGLALTALVGWAPSAGASDDNLWGVTADEELVRIDREDPAHLVGDPLPIETPGDVFGLATWEGALHALTRQGDLLRLNPQTGAVERTAPGCTPASSGPVSMTSRNHENQLITVGVDDVAVSFDPFCAVDAYDNPTYEVEDINYQDGTGAPADPEIVAVTQYRGDELLGIDTASDMLVWRRYWYSDWTEIGPLGVDVSPPVALEDHKPSKIQGVPATYMAAGGVLYDVNTYDGAATAIGPIGSGLVIRDMASIPPPRIYAGADSISPPGYLVGEGETKMGTLTREGDPVPEVTVAYEFVNPPWGQPSTPGEDFVPEKGTVTFASGQRQVQLRLPNIDDDVAEGDESFALRLDGGPEHPVGIVDDDLDFPGAEITVPEATGTVELPGGRPGGLPAAADLVLAPAAGATATAGEDYTVPSPVAVPFGATGGKVRLPIVDDRVLEGTETIVLQRRSSAPFSHMTHPVVVHIADDDSTRLGDLPSFTPPPLDAAAPAVAFGSALSGGLRLGRRGPAIALTCSEACSLALDLRLDRRTARRLHLARSLGRGTAKGLAGRRTTARIVIARRILARLRRARRVRATLDVVATDAAGNRRRVSRRVLLKR